MRALISSIFNFASAGNSAAESSHVTRERDKNNLNLNFDFHVSDEWDELNEKIAKMQEGAKSPARLSKDIGDMLYVAAENEKSAAKKKIGYEEAWRFSDHAIELDPQAEWQHYDRGLAELKLGKYAQAKEDFAAEIKLAEDLKYPSYEIALARSYYEISYVYLEEGKEDERIDYLKKAAAIESEDLSVQMAKKVLQELEEYYWNGGNAEDRKPQEAINDFEKVLRLSSDVNIIREAHYSLGVYYGMLGKVGNAIEHFKQVSADSSELRFPELQAYAQNQIVVLEKAQKEKAESGKWGYRDYGAMFLAVVLGLPVLRVIGAYVDEKKNILPDEQVDPAVRSFARTIVGSVFDLENLSKAEKLAIASLGQDKVNEIIDGMKPEISKEEYGKFLEAKLSSHDARPKEIAAFKQSMNDVFGYLRDSAKTQDSKNFLYDKILQDTSSHKHLILPSYLKRASKIFNEEATSFAKQVCAEFLENYAKKAAEVREKIERVKSSEQLPAGSPQIEESKNLKDEARGGQTQQQK